MRRIALLAVLTVATATATETDASWEQPLGKCRTVRNTTLTCWEATADDLPTEKREAITWLLFVNSSLPVMERNRMKLYPALTDLHASKSGVERIEKDAFDDLPDLNWVDLSGNRLSALDPDLFRAAHNLYYLNLSSNAGLRLPENGPFLDSPKLNWLDLGHCGIERLHPETFARLRGLKVLSLPGNRIAEISQRTFAPLQNLYSLDLSGNLLKTASPDVFHDRKQLRLYLGGNPWKCDCSLRPFIEWAKETRRLKEEVRCAAPEDLPWSEFDGEGCPKTAVEAF